MLTQRRFDKPAMAQRMVLDTTEELQATLQPAFAQIGRTWDSSDAQREHLPRVASARHANA
jgi:hypothetical protein